MRDNPHEHQILREKDTEHVLTRFEEEYEWSLIQNKFAIDTSDRTPQETLDEFVRRFSPYITEADKKVAHHMSRDFFVGPDQNFIGFHIEEAVYAPLYYGYGGEDSGAAFRSGTGQRTEMARAVEKELMRLAPDAAVVLLKARPEAIRQRMRDNPHEHQILREKDTEHVLTRFEEEYEWSLIQNKFAIDTSDRTPQETLDEFVRRFSPYITEADRSPTWSEDRKEQIDRAWASYL